MNEWRVGGVGSVSKVAVVDVMIVFFARPRGVKPKGLEFSHVV